MVIGPKKLVEKIEQKESDVIKNLETKIDDALVKNFDGRHASVGYEPGQVRKFVLDGLLDQYRGAGWDVKITGDQRDGDYIHFTYTPQRDSGYDGYSQTR